MFNNLAGKKWPYIVGGMLFLIIIGNSANVSRTSSSSSESSSTVQETSEPMAVAKPLGGYCAGTMAALDDVVQILGNATDYPFQEITEKLKDKGEMLAYGYDATMVPTPSELKLVTEAGSQMLKIRARLIDGGDALVPGQALLESYDKLGNICR